MEDFYITITVDEALVLYDYFERLDETDALSFRHAAECVALRTIHHQVCKVTPAMFMPDYKQQVAAARERIAGDYEFDVPGTQTR